MDSFKGINSAPAYKQFYPQLLQSHLGLGSHLQRKKNHSCFCVAVVLACVARPTLFFVYFLLSAGACALSRQHRPTKNGATYKATGQEAQQEGQHQKKVSIATQISPLQQGKCQLNDIYSLCSYWGFHLKHSSKS